MAHDTDLQLDPQDTRRLEERAWPLFRNALLVGLIGLGIAALLAVSTEDGLKRFAFAYLAAFAFVLSIALGSLFFVMATYLFRAGWVVVVRRPAEVLAATMPTVGILFVPVLLFAVVPQTQFLYPWSASDDELMKYSHHAHDDHAEHADEAHGDDGHGQEHGGEDHAEDSHAAGWTQIVTVADTGDAHGDAESLDGEDAHAGGHGEGIAHADLLLSKRPYLNKPFFVLRWVVFLAIWSWLGVTYWKKSTQQDATGEPQLTRKLEVLSAPAILIFALTLTFAAVDLLKSLDGMFFSTMWGVYYFAGSFLSSIAVLILVLMGLQLLGFAKSVTTEHFHDLGKLLFAFTFFWGYIAYSQYMLIWYGNIPEETPWMEAHGLTTSPENITAWTWVGLILLFGHLLIPFAGLLSRHVKRNRKALAFWAVWLLVFHYIDLWWVVMPMYDATTIHEPLMELLCVVGVAALFLAGAIRVAAGHSLVPVKDPRLAESLRFENI